MIRKSGAYGMKAGNYFRDWKGRACIVTEFLQDGDCYVEYTGDSDGILKGAHACLRWSQVYEDKDLTKKMQELNNRQATIAEAIWDFRD